ncbi:UNKNOWN [Stylonychia lemnae]|uniref:Uncharacterized protein n=1 Tax=Stylonychia lemnae TaxID=5949 RepID=A0A078AHH0_STYLE|nr:UNKNOWN [Stylonychia lemnae]|eukprot:CDW80942.1 UNKNOWN [Stylonychia lemnae]
MNNTQLTLLNDNTKIDSNASPQNNKSEYNSPERMSKLSLKLHNLQNINPNIAAVQRNATIQTNHSSMKFDNDNTNHMNKTAKSNQNAMQNNLHPKTNLRKDSDQTQNSQIHKEKQGGSQLNRFANYRHNIIQDSGQQNEYQDDFLEEDLIKKYFFHSDYWQTIKKKQQFLNLKREGMKTQVQSPINIERMIQETRLPELQKIKSKQRRIKKGETESNYRFSLESQNWYNEVDMQNKSLENHVDGEIFIPKTLLDESVLQSHYNQQNQKNEPKALQSAQNRRSSHQSQRAKAQETPQESQINKSLLEIEQRLGLKKKNPLEEINQMVNIRQTEQNIDLLQKEIVHLNNEKPFKISQSSKRQQSTIMKGAERYIISPSQDSQIHIDPTNRSIFLDYSQRRQNSDESQRIQRGTGQVKTKDRFSAKVNEFQNFSQGFTIGESVLLQSKDLRKSGIKGGHNQVLNQHSVQLRDPILEQGVRLSRKYQSVNTSMKISPVKQSIDRNYDSQLDSPISIKRDLLNRTLQSTKMSQDQYSISNRLPSQMSNKCHGLKVFETKTDKQKLIERLFDHPKELVLNKAKSLHHEQQEEEELIQKQEQKVKEEVKHLLLGILDQSLTPRTSSVPLRNPEKAASPTMQFQPMYNKNTPNFLQLITQIDKKGNPHFADENQFQQIQSLFNKWYNYKEPDIQGKGKNGKKGSKDDGDGNESFQSFLDSDFIDEEKLLKVGSDSLDNAKFGLYNKYLNVLLLKTGDPFVAQQYQKYLRIKRKGHEQKKQNFYQRMQKDISKRKQEDSQSHMFLMNDQKRNTILRFGTNITNNSGIFSQRNSNKGDSTPVKHLAARGSFLGFSRQQANQLSNIKEQLLKSKDSHEYILHDVPENTTEEFDNMDNSSRSKSSVPRINFPSPNHGSSQQVPNMKPRMSRLVNKNASALVQNPFGFKMFNKAGTLIGMRSNKKSLNLIDKKIQEMEKEVTSSLVNNDRLSIIRQTPVNFNFGSL